jgi:hypothetical protein
MRLLCSTGFSSVRLFCVGFRNADPLENGAIGNRNVREGSEHEPDGCQVSIQGTSGALEICQASLVIDLDSKIVQDVTGAHLGFVPILCPACSRRGST